MADATGPTDPDPTGASLALKPTGQDIASNSQTQAQVAQSGMDSSASAAATGLTGTASASLALTTSSPVLGQATEKTSITRDCYLGSTVQTRSGTLTWPESTSATSPFAD